MQHTQCGGDDSDDDSDDDDDHQKVLKHAAAASPNCGKEAVDDNATEQVHILFLADLCHKHNLPAGSDDRRSM